MKNDIRRILFIDRKLKQLCKNNNKSLLETNKTSISNGIKNSFDNNNINFAKKIMNRNLNETNSNETYNKLKTNEIESNEANSNLNPSIEQLLLNDSLITEITYMHSPQHSFYFTSNNIIKLIDFSTHMPYINDDEILTHKFPFNSCELLKSDTEYIYNKFFEDNLENYDNIKLGKNSCT